MNYPDVRGEDLWRGWKSTPWQDLKILRGRKSFGHSRSNTSRNDESWFSGSARVDKEMGKSR